MKRDDLEVSRAYYYSRSTNWQTDTWSAGRAVLVDNFRYMKPTLHGLRRGNEPTLRHPRGRFVLVDLYRDGFPPAREVVSPAHLRGPWEATKALVDKSTAERNQARRAEQARLSTLLGQAVIAADRARKLGVEAQRSFRDEGWVNVPAADLAAMVTALEQIGWKHGKEGS